MDYERSRLDMIVTKDNIKELFFLLKKTFLNTIVMEYSGWENQINPFNIVEGEPDEIAFRKEYAENVEENAFLNVERDSLGGEEFIRFVSREYDKNFVIEIGMEIYVNMFDKQIVIIESNSPLKKLLKKDKDINPFTVFLFTNKERLEELETFC